MPYCFYEPPPSPDAPESGFIGAIASAVESLADIFAGGPQKRERAAKAAAAAAQAQAEAAKTAAETQAIGQVLAAQTALAAELARQRQARVWPWVIGGAGALYALYRWG